MDTQDKMIRLREAAARLGVSVRTLYRLFATHDLSLLHVRGCSCVAESELMTYLERLKGGAR